MEEYIVSARKYRPLNFDAVIGQRPLTTTLKNAINSGKLAHAYLFCGPRGVGKTTCARIFAKAINCLHPQEGGEPCGQCESCQAFDQQRSMNIHELDAASNNSVDDMRELCKQVLIPPQTGRYKVFIIDEVHMLSPGAFNAFLKTLEEPPSYVIFILATTEKHKILPTILSRCQVYDFQRMTTQGIVDHLKYVAEKEGYTAEPEALTLIAEKADGGMRDALSIFDQMVSFSDGNITYENVCQNLNVLSQEYYFQLVDHFLASRVSESLLLLNDVLQKGFDAGHFIAGLATHMRNLLVSRDTATLPLLEMSERMRSRYHEQALRAPVGFIYKALKLANDCDLAYRTSHNKRLQVELCLIQCVQDEATTNTAKEQTDPPPAAPKPAEEEKRQLPKVSFKHFGGTKKKEDTSLADINKGNEPQQVLAEPVDAEKLTSAWYTYISSLPHDSVALAQRLKGLQPTLKDANTAEMTFSNPQVQQTVESQMPQILNSMRQSLRNHSFSIETRLEEEHEVVKSYSAPEMLKIMQDQNTNVGDLIGRLQLAFD